MPKGWDFFISYTGADTAWAEWIADTLEQAGYSTVLQAWDFRPGENFIRRMNQALDQANQVLAVMTPAYFASEYAADEWTAALVRDRGSPDRLVPVRVEPFLLPPLVRIRIYIDLVGLKEPAAAKQLLAGVQRGRAKPPGRRPYPGKPLAASFPGRRPAIFHVLPRNKHFTGRVDLLQALREQLTETSAGAVVQAGAVHGLGGVGKTQLAVEYAHRYAADYDLVWWLAAEQVVTIPEQLAAFARRLGLPELAGLEEQVGVVFDELGQRDRWLLVYDNAQTPTDLEGLRPPAGGGHIMITSRNPAWGGIADTIAVDVLPRDQATSFLVQRTGSSDRATLERLAEALGDLPLALEQAAAYLEDTRIPPGEYLGLFSERAGELLMRGQPLAYRGTVDAAFTLGIDRLDQADPAAPQLLHLCALLAPDEIPVRWLLGNPDLLPSPLADAARDTLRVHKITQALNRAGLFGVDVDDTVRVHRLVQAVALHHLPADRHQLVSDTIQLLATLFTEDPWQPAAWPACARLLPHAYAVLEHASHQQLITPELADLLFRMGSYVLERGLGLTRARDLLEQSLILRQRLYQGDHPAIAGSLNNLAIAVYEMGDYTRARELHEQSLALFRRLYEGDHPNIADGLNNLGEDLRTLGELERARDLDEQALAMRQRLREGDHPDLAHSLHCLADDLHALGDLGHARNLHEQALAMRQRLYKGDHPDLANSIGSLTGDLRALGELERARDLDEQALAMRQRLYEGDHRNIAYSLDDLAGDLRALGEHSAARHLHEQALAMRQRLYEGDHPDVAQSLNDLADDLDELGEDATARDLREQAQAMRQQFMERDGSTS